MATKIRYELPEAVAPFFGEINDVDGHENLPMHLWEKEFGSEVRAMGEALVQAVPLLSEISEADNAEINSENVRYKKLVHAPGAFDFNRRVDVLDFVGTKRQLMFPGAIGGHAGGLVSMSDNPTFCSAIKGDRRSYGRRVAKIVNEWAILKNKEYPRLRMVGMLFDETPELLYASAKSMIDQGIRALWMSTDEPPGGFSPAHPVHDPLWQLLSETKTPILGHISVHERVFRTMDWRVAPVFQQYNSFPEISGDPLTMSTMHVGFETFLSALVLGGVFERFPDLRIGVAELGGQWVGPLAERLDLWQSVTKVPVPVVAQQERPILSMKPSEYIKKHLRVSCFFFEDVGSYIRDWGLEDVYCYGSDYPHIEGGTQPIENFTQSIVDAGLGQDVLRKFFVDNAKDILPD